jgi:hypothetical protein
MRANRKLGSAAAFIVAVGLTVLLIDAPWSTAQQQQSGGAGSVVTANIGTTNGLALNATLTGGTQETKLVDTGGTNLASISAGGALKVDNSAVTQPVSGTFWQGTQPVSGTLTVNALPGGTNSIGIVRSAPSSCTQSTNFTASTVGVAITTGTSVTSTTTCVTLVYVNNITNSAVTFRLQDKTGTPIIWVGGNADFSVPANSNVTFPLGGVVFTSGITAIAGTGSALNLQVSGLQ